MGIAKLPDTFRLASNTAVTRNQAAAANPAVTGFGALQSLRGPVAASPQSPSER
jgi:hypothetical protein